MTPRLATPRIRRQRGAALFEALLSMLVLALGMLSIGHMQTQLRAGAELARQRTQAVRHAQEDMERQRAYAVVAGVTGARAWADITSAAGVVVDDGSGNAGGTRYVLDRDVAGDARLKLARVTVRWTDRAGAAQQVALDSAIAASDPAHGGALSLAAPPLSRPRLVQGRSPAVPLAAKDLGDGRSVLKPSAAGTGALLFDNANGAVIGRCTLADPARRTDELGPADLIGCDSLRGLRLAGVVRFSSASPPDPGWAHDAPLPLAVVLTLDGGAGTPAPHCVVEARKLVRMQRGGRLTTQAVPLGAQAADFGLPGWTETGDQHAAYECVVYPPAGAAAWSGRLDVLPDGWPLGSGALQWRVCRYSTDLDGSGAVDANIEHPAQYSGVGTALAHQNFLVVRGSETCPATAPGRAHVDLRTVAHQP